LRVYEIDGSHFSTLEGFWDEVGEVMLPGVSWGRNLDAFNDILRGDFGDIPVGFEFVWRNHELSRVRLGYPETVRQLQARVELAHSTGRELVQRELDMAREGRGPSVFNWLVEILQDHGPGGDESDDGVVLILA